jgi:ABC-type nitrate/sulfonate/bicarbonate transport system substrate-binding protein
MHMSEISRRILTRLILLMALLALIAGCGGKEEIEKGDIPVVAVGSQWYGHIPVWVGIERGTFEKHG